MEYPLIGQSFIYTCAKGCTYILHLLREWVCIFKWLNTSFPGEMPMVLHVGMLFAHMKTPAVTVKHTQWLCRCWKKRVLPRTAILLRTEISKSKAVKLRPLFWSHEPHLRPKMIGHCLSIDIQPCRYKSCKLVQLKHWPFQRVLCPSYLSCLWFY